LRISPRELLDIAWQPGDSRVQRSPVPQECTTGHGGNAPDESEPATDGDAPVPVSLDHPSSPALEDMKLVVVVAGLAFVAAALFVAMEIGGAFVLAFGVTVVLASILMAGGRRRRGAAPK